MTGMKPIAQLHQISLEPLFHMCVRYRNFLPLLVMLSYIGQTGGVPLSLHTCHLCSLCCASIASAGEHSLFTLDIDHATVVSELLFSCIFSNSLHKTLECFPQNTYWVKEQRTRTSVLKRAAHAIQSCRYQFEAN